MGLGLNDNGQIGTGRSSVSGFGEPVAIGKNARWRQIQAGTVSSFALNVDGTIWAWGQNGVPFNTISYGLTPSVLDGGTNWFSISAGSWHLLALKRDGTLWICGESASGVARDSVSGPTTSRVQVGSDSDWAEIHSGDNSFVARKKVNSWWFCGSTDVGPSRVTAPQRLPFDCEPIAIAAGESTVVFLTADGALWSWGIRMGAKSRVSLGENIQRLLNRVDSRLFRWQLRSINLGMPDDRSPHKIWSLPAELERELCRSPVERGGEKLSDSNTFPASP